MTYMLKCFVSPLMLSSATLSPKSKNCSPGLTPVSPGGQLKLLNLTQKLQDLLAITKLLTVFDVYNDEGEALGTYQ